MKTQHFIFGCLLALFICLHATSAQEVEDESEFDYEKKSKKGPKYWGDIKEEWAACKNGKMQSPIDMSDKRVKVIPKLGVLKKNYKPSNATINNRGHDIAVHWLGEGDAGSIRISGTKYFLKQCHWHSPSEHSVNGRRYDMELHMVHVSSDPNAKYKIAVVGILYKFGQPDNFLSTMMNNISAMVDTKAERRMGVIDPRGIKLGSSNYYRYIGSLTVPPCTEGVIWTISKMVKTVSKKQVKLMRHAVHDFAEMNYRPVQALNHRDVSFYGHVVRPNDISN